jgi:hypothetical protein
MIEKAAFVWSVNEAWAMLAAFALLGVLVVPFAWKTAKARRLGADDRENLQDRWTPAIHLDKEPAIAVVSRTRLPSLRRQSSRRPNLKPRMRYFDIS